LLYFDGEEKMNLQQDYFSRPQSHLLVDRLMEVREEATGEVLYRSPTLHGIALGGPLQPGEGDRDFSERLVRLDDGTHVFLISHVHKLEGRQLVIRLGYDLKPLRERMLQFCLLLLLGIPVALALAAALGQRIARRALWPLERMTARAEGITANNLHDRLEVGNPDNPEDELGQMARVFNGLLQRLEEAFLQLKRFTADAAHELRTPLSSLRAVGEIALQSPRTAEEYRSTLSDILEETGRLSATIDSLLLLSRAEAIRAGEPVTSFSLKQVVAEVLSLLEVMMEDRSIQVVEDNDIPDQDTVLGDRSLIRVVVLNVLHNAVKFSPNGSTLRIAYATLEESSSFVRLTVQDEGPGIYPGEELLIFERFFTSSSSEKTKTGTGLGLAIAKLIMERSGGRVSFDHDVPQGARCVIDVPITL
jgi:heavy metal sensor kinase